MKEDNSFTHFVFIILQFRLHNPIETPKVAEFGHFLSPGKEYRVIIKPTVTKASTAIKGIPIKKRQCVFSNETYLKYYRTYTQRNCALECEANYTLEMCHCVPYYLPSNYFSLFWFFPLTSCLPYIIILKLYGKGRYKGTYITKIEIKIKNNPYPRNSG